MKSYTRDCDFEYVYYISLAIKKQMGARWY